MKKLLFMLREIKLLILKHKLYFLTPLLILLIIVSLLFVKVGAGLLMTFIYAGV